MVCYTISYWFLLYICCCRYCCYCRLLLLLTSILCSIYIYVRQTHTHKSAHSHLWVRCQITYVELLLFFDKTSSQNRGTNVHVFLCMKTSRKTRAWSFLLKRSRADAFEWHCFISNKRKLFNWSGLNAIENVGFLRIIFPRQLNKWNCSFISTKLQLQPNIHCSTSHSPTVRIRMASTSHTKQGALWYKMITRTLNK